MVRSFLRNGRKHYGTGSSRERHDHVRRQSSNTAIASFARAAEPGARDQSEDGGEVAQAGDGRGYEDRANGTAVHRAGRSRGSDDRGISSPHAAAFGRLPLRSTAINPAPDPFSVAPVLAAARHLALARCRRGQAQAREVQALPHRLLPHRHS